MLVTYQAKLLNANKTSMSAFTAPHPRSDNDAKNHLKHYRPVVRNRTKQSLLSNPRNRYMLMQRNGTILSFSCAVVLEDEDNDNESVIVARLGDSVTGETLIKFKLDDFFTGTLALVKDGARASAGLRSLSGQVVNLVNDNMDRIPMEELPWTDAEYPNCAVLAFCDKIHVVPPTYKIYDGHSITDALPVLADDERAWQPLRDVLEVFAFHMEHYAGHSVHHTQHSKCADSNWHSEDGEFYNDRQAIGANLDTTFFTDIVIILPSSRLGMAALPLINEQLEVMLQHEAVTLADPTATEPGAAPSSAAAGELSNMSEILKGTLAFMKQSSEGSKTSQKKKVIDRCTNLWNCLLSHKTIGSGGDMVMEPLPLSPAFIELMDTSDQLEQLRLLKHGLDDTKWQARKANKAEGLLGSLNVDCFNGPFVRCVVRCHIHSEPLNACINTLNKMISVFNFAPVAKNNKALQLMLVTDGRFYYENFHDDDAKTGKTHDIFIDGDMQHINSIRETLYNFILFLSFICPRYAETYIHVKLMKYMAILNSPGGDTFLSSTVAISPHMKHNLLCDIQQLISACWRPWLTNNRLVSQAAAGDEVLCKDTSDYADQACDSIFQKLEVACYGGHAAYDLPTSSFHFFQARRNPPRAPQKRDNQRDERRRDDPRREDNRQDKRPRQNNHEAGGGNRPDANRPGPPRINIELQKLQRTVGVLTCTAFPPTHFPHRFQSMNNKILCTNFATTGLCCPFEQADCHFAHILRLKDLSAADHKAFAAWVKNTTNMTWAAGKGPSNSGANNN